MATKTYKWSGGKLVQTGGEPETDADRKRHRENMRTILRDRKAPMTLGDDTFFLGEKNGEQFAHNPALGDRYAAQLRAAGGSPAGKRYVHGLAAYPGDPRAWVSSTAEIKALLEERNWSTVGDGQVTHQATELPPPPSVTVDPELVEEEFEEILDADPEIAPTAKEQAELKEKIREERTPWWKKAGNLVV